MSKIAAHMICHTHWDREWYLTREVFRTKLVRLIDKILDIIDASPEYVSFMLDGQTIALKDYLEIRPENQERLKCALGSGKILCGPWYILPDELLISGESHIRNYIIGSKVAAKYGGHMNVAYLPDSFGHPEQMPQIVEGLGMNTMVFWRGTSNAMKHTEFIWQSPYRASKVFCVHLPSGYGNSARLFDDETTVSRLEDMIQVLHERSLADTVILMNGSDHIIAQDDIVQIVNRFNENTKTDSHIKLSTMEEFVEELKNQLGDLEIFSGELRYGDRSLLLGGTLSTRMDLKQRNHEVQKKMERYLEPIKVWEQLIGTGKPYIGYSNYIWEKILENHPHDSICGCSIDEVHKEIYSRFDCVQQLEDELINQSFKEIEEELESGEVKADAQLMIFEPTQDGLPDYVEIEVDIDPTLVQEVNYATSSIIDYEDSIEHPDIPTGLIFKDEYGHEIDHAVLSMNKAYYKHLQDETLPQIYKVNRVKVGLLLPSYDFGFHLVNVYKHDKKDQDPETNKAITIENEFYKIEFNDNTGCLNVLDKKSGKLHIGVHKIIDKGDAGDEYTYSWPLNDKVYGFSTNSVVATIEGKGKFCSVMRIKGIIELPEQLSEDRKSRSEILTQTDIEVEISLYKGIDRIDFHTVIHNNSKDHRLQVEFPCGILAKQSCSSGAFAVTKRNIELTIPEHWVEYPQSNHPTHGFVDVGNDEYGVSMASIGLTEYEAENTGGQSFVRLTLLRCVGWLSRTDLLTREGNGGWTIETPDAQCLGKHEFEYSINYHNGEWGESNSYQLCDRRIHGVKVQQLRGSEGNAVMEDNYLSFISRLPKEVRISAVKPTETGNSIITRMFNISNQSIQKELKLPGQIRAAYTTNLKEDRLEQLRMDSGSININIEPSQIATYEFEL